MPDTKRDALREVKLDFEQRQEAVRLSECVASDPDMAAHEIVYLRAALSQADALPATDGAEPTPVGEPFAWVFRSRQGDEIERRWHITFSAAFLAEMPRKHYEVQPLYTEPPPVESSTHALREEGGRALYDAVVEIYSPLWEAIANAGEARPYWEALSDKTRREYCRRAELIKRAALASTSAEPPVGDAALRAAAVAVAEFDLAEGPIVREKKMQRLRAALAVPPDAPRTPEVVFCVSCGEPARGYADRAERQWWRTYCSLSQEFKQQMRDFASTLAVKYAARTPEVQNALDRIEFEDAVDAGIVDRTPDDAPSNASPKQGDE